MNTFTVIHLHNMWVTQCPLLPFPLTTFKIGVGANVKWGGLGKAIFEFALYRSVKVTVFVKPQTGMNLNVSHDSYIAQVKYGCVTFRSLQLKP